MAEKQRILIVDDDYNIAELISLYLTKECFETKIVGDGEEALRVFPEFQPNLILLDLMLPGIDGYQVCRELRSTSQVPIIMLSAKGEIFDKVLGLELGADDYMIKPFDSKELVARVKAVLRRYHRRRAGRLCAEPDQAYFFFPVCGFGHAVGCARAGLWTDRLFPGWLLLRYADPQPFCDRVPRFGLCPE